MGQINLVRHGQASAGADHYDQLSDVGIEQSKLLGQWLGNCGQRFTGVVTGSLARHRQTAEACLAALPPEARPVNGWITDAGFDEYDHDELMIRYRPDFADPKVARATLLNRENGRRAFQEIFSAAMARWMGGQHDSEYRESWMAFRGRVVNAVTRLVQTEGSSQNILVFTSGGPIAAICQELLGIPDARTAELNTTLVNGGVTRLLYQPGRVSLSYLNNFAHLEQVGAKAITYR
jgi:broad specificity phosphatase PhoE